FTLPATLELYPLSLHDALPISSRTKVLFDARADALAEMSGLMGGLPRSGTHESAMLWNLGSGICSVLVKDGQIVDGIDLDEDGADRKSTRLNSSHDQISYAVFC